MGEFWNETLTSLGNWVLESVCIYYELFGWNIWLQKPHYPSAFKMEESIHNGKMSNLCEFIFIGLNDLKQMKPMKWNKTKKLPKLYVINKCI